jgi:hypothetical protein
MAHEAKVESLLNELDGSGSDAEWVAAQQLRDMLNGDLPKYLIEKYKTQRSWRPRSSYVYHSVRYARESDSAVELGKQALTDKSGVVRYRACMLLAYSLRQDVLSFLKQVETNDPKTREDIRAAIDAITSQNHHFFVDRDHSGQVTLNIR